MKEGMMMHSLFKVAFKWALHFNTLTITRFNSATKFFQTAINTTTLGASLLSNFCTTHFLS